MVSLYNRSSGSHINFVFGLAGLIFLLTSSLQGFSATYYSRVATGNFAAVASWSTSPTGTPTNAAALVATDVFIIQNAHNITVAVAQTVAGITIDAGGTLTSGAAITLTLNGPWVKNGTFTPSTGTVTFGGAAAAINTGTGTANFNNIIVASGATLGINTAVSAAGTFTYAATTANSTVNISGTNSLSVTGNWSMPLPSANMSSTVSVGAGTLSVTGSFTMSGSAATTPTTMTITSGTVNLGAVSTVALGSFFTFNGAGIMNISGALTNGPPVITESTGTVNFTGAAAQTIWTETYYNLGFSGAGTKTIATGSTATVLGDWNVNSPVTMTTTAAANVTGGITGNGAITMGSGIIALEGAWTNSGTFTRGTGTVNFDGAGAQTIPVLAFANLQATIGGTKTLAGNTTVNNVLTVSTPATLNLSTFTVTLPLTGSPLVITGTLAGTGKVLFSGATAQTVAGTTYYDVEFSGVGTKTIAAGTTLTATNNWIVGSPTTFTTTAGANIVGTISGAGNITMGSGTIFLEGNWTNNGTLTPGTGTINYDGAGAQSVSVLSYYNLQVTIGGTKTLAGNITVSNILTVSTPATFNLGVLTVTLPLTGSPLVISGTLSGTGKVLFSGAAAQTVAGTTYYDLEFSGAGTKTIATATTVTTTNNWIIGSATTMTGTGSAIITADVSGAGALTMGSGSISVAGSWTKTGTFTAGTGTINYNGTTQTIATLTYYNLQTSASGVKTLAASTTVSNVLTINSLSTIDLSTFTLTLSAAGTPLVNTGTFTASTSTVSFTNAASTNIPAVNFFNLNGTGGPRVLANTGTIGIAGTFTKGAGIYTITGSTVNFNGAAQTIPAFTFNDLILSGSLAKTILTATIVNVNTIEIQNGPTLDLPGTAQLNITKP